MDISTFLGLTSKAVITFFQAGIWVVGFFYLLLKTIKNKDLETLSKYIIGICLGIILFSSIFSVFNDYSNLNIIEKEDSQ
ncbi:hypothetical protein IHV10_06480 [Fictibacillus sp. 5RED26]|uniref:hypothetical protein n=1 Tax=Fictibacillus sp. 5RED26 TaxID=2745876 RepID=UPI0018CFB4C8|nr:hypothetical protein [Fictibacillus sp. 5RED26]